MSLRHPVCNESRQIYTHTQIDIYTHKHIVGNGEHVNIITYLYGVFVCVRILKEHAYDTIYL